MLKRVPLVVMVVAALGGCGGSDDDGEKGPVVPSEERAILQTVADLETASRQGDARRICDEIFTKTLADSIENAADRSCSAEVRATLVSPNMRLSVGRNIDVNGARAIATVREKGGDTSKVFLRKHGSRWQIARITPAKS
jgi:hypothetical protein